MVTYYIKIWYAKFPNIILTKKEKYKTFNINTTEICIIVWSASKLKNLKTF